jgi:hypothetical protein
VMLQTHSPFEVKVTHFFFFFSVQLVMLFTLSYVCLCLGSVHQYVSYCFYEYHSSRCPVKKNTRKIRVKGKSDPVTDPVWPRGWVQVKLYSSMTAALERGEWSAARPGRTLPPRKTRYPSYRRVGPTAGLDGRKLSSSPGFDPWTVQPGSSVAIPTELPGAQKTTRATKNLETLSSSA